MFQDANVQMCYDAKMHKAKSAQDHLSIARSNRFVHGGEGVREVTMMLVVVIAVLCLAMVALVMSGGVWWVSDGWYGEGCYHLPPVSIMAPKSVLKRPASQPAGPAKKKPATNSHDDQMQGITTPKNDPKAPKNDEEGMRHTHLGISPCALHYTIFASRQFDMFASRILASWHRGIFASRNVDIDLHRREQMARGHVIA